MFSLAFAFVFLNCAAGKEKANTDSGHRVDKYYNRAGDVIRIVTYYEDAQGRKVLDGVSSEIKSYGIVTTEYKDGVVIKMSYHGEGKNP